MKIRIVDCRDRSLFFSFSCLSVRERERERRISLQDFKHDDFTLMMNRSYLRKQKNSHFNGSTPLRNWPLPSH